MKERWFVLENGIIRYYLGEDKRPPYGRSERGFIEVPKYVLSSDPSFATDLKLFLKLKSGVTSSSDAQQYLLQCTDQADFTAWKEALIAHMNYYSNR